MAMTRQRLWGYGWLMGLLLTAFLVPTAKANPVSATQPLLLPTLTERMDTFLLAQREGRRGARRGSGHRARGGAHRTHRHRAHRQRSRHMRRAHRQRSRQVRRVHRQRSREMRRVRTQRHREWRRDRRHIRHRDVRRLRHDGRRHHRRDRHFRHRYWYDHNRGYSLIPWAIWLGGNWKWLLLDMG